MGIADAFDIVMGSFNGVVRNLSDKEYGELLEDLIDELMVRRTTREVS